MIDKNLPFFLEVVALDIEDINPTLERMLSPQKEDGIGIPGTENKTQVRQYHYIKRNGQLGARLTYVTGDEFEGGRLRLTE